ncbi:xenoxin-3-like [Anguilla anguilla]|uniref:xenoxin-3-like n=1 Tax=Anguilla anguilla TaxID=7936 RepID=UPI0015A9F54E|nr:xenoxin-3-like [Anguilla anguilla]
MKPLVTLALACALFSGAFCGSLNEKMCFTCVGNDCTRIQECEGSEDRCLKSTVFFTAFYKVTMKGCASETECSGAMNSGTAIIGREMSCCEGNLCNNALRIGQSVLFLLLVPLASVILFN